MGNPQGRVAPASNVSSLSSTEPPLIFNDIQVHANPDSVTILEARAYIRFGEEIMLSRSSFTTLGSGVDINNEIQKAEEQLRTYLESLGVPTSIRSEGDDSAAPNQENSAVTATTSPQQPAIKSSNLRKSEIAKPAVNKEHPLTGEALKGDRLQGDALTGDPLPPDLFASKANPGDQVEQPLMDMLEKKLKAAGQSKDDFDIDFRDPHSVKQLISELTPEPEKVY